MIEWIKLHNFIWCAFAIDCVAGARRIWRRHHQMLENSQLNALRKPCIRDQLNPEPEINQIYFPQYSRIYLSLSYSCPVLHKPPFHSICTNRYLLYILHPFEHIYDVRFSAFLWKNKNRNRCRLLSTYYNGIYIQKR